MTTLPALGLPFRQWHNVMTWPMRRLEPLFVPFWLFEEMGRSLLDA
jgi:hypothetical protein